MRVRERLARGLGVTMLAGALAACGGGQAGGASPAAQSSPTESVAASPQAQASPAGALASPAGEPVASPAVDVSVPMSPPEATSPAAPTESGAVASPAATPTGGDAVAAASPPAEEPTATAPSVSVPTVKPTGTARPTATGPLPAGYTRFTSKANPYSIGYPKGWRAQGNAVRFGDIRADVFTPPVARGGGGASINVLSERLPAGLNLDTERYVELTLENLRRGGAKPKQVGRLPAGDEEAILVQGASATGAANVELRQAVWVAGGRGWVATLATPKNQLGKYLPEFRRMVSTFETRER